MTHEWYTSGPRQRLQPGGSIIIVQTRWSMKDLTGRLLADQGKDILSDKWEVIEFPAIMPSGNPLWLNFGKRRTFVCKKRLCRQQSGMHSGNRILRLKKSP